METNKNKTKENKKMAGKYLNPKADLTFKLVFGEHEDLMMSLLNALLPIAETSPIIHLEYLSPEMVPDRKGRKDSIVDVRCKDSSGRQFIVEMQMHWNEDFMKRVLLNASKSVVKQAGMSEKYRQIQPVFSLNLINDTRFQPDSKEFYHDYAIINVEHPEKTIDGLRFVFVELPKFQPRSIAEKKMAVLWLRYLTEISEETKVAPKELLENEQTRKALKIIEKSAMSEAQIMAYEDFMMSIEDEQVLREGFYKEGMAKGIAKGIAQAEEKSRLEKLESARRLKAMNLTASQISEAIGLTVEEIESL